VNVPDPSPELVEAAMRLLASGCVVCGASAEEVGISAPGPSVCPLMDEDEDSDQWEEMNCLALLLPRGGFS
jgi:hypothetical protein